MRIFSISPAVLIDALISNLLIYIKKMGEMRIICALTRPHSTLFEVQMSNVTVSL